MKQYMKLTLVTFLGCLAFGQVATAELNVDSRAMYDRMDRLERDLTLLQRKLYKGAARQDEKDTAPAAINAPEGSVQHLYAKINEQEQIVSQMTAQIEELSHQLIIAQEDLRRMNADVDFRLNEVKNAAVSASAPTPASVQVSETKEPKDAKTAYNEAYSLLKQLKYDEAEVALKAFLEKYPNDDLAGNAQYWLGETYYVRGFYEAAAVAFATGFKNYKKSTKGADNLLKLGLTMQQLEKNEEACTAFKSLKKEFPKASILLLSRAQKEIKRLGCDK